MSKTRYYVNVYSNKNKKELDYLKIRSEGFHTTIPKTYLDQNNLNSNHSLPSDFNI